MSLLQQFLMEGRETETTTSINKPKFEKVIIVKSKAQRQREYRRRKKLQNQLKKPKKIPKTNAERRRLFRQRQKEKLQQNETLDLARKKDDAERAKRYRDKLKLKKQCAELDSVQSSEEDPLPTVLIENKEETNHRHDTNCEKLILSQFQIEQSINTEAQQVISPSSTSFEASYEETPNPVLFVSFLFLLCLLVISK